MTKEESTKIVNFMTPIIVNMHYMYLQLYQYTTHWLLLYKGIIMLLSCAIVDFYQFYDMAVDMQIWALLTKSQCRVSDTHVTVKACGPLVKIHINCIKNFFEMHVCLNLYETPKIANSFDWFIFLAHLIPCHLSSVLFTFSSPSPKPLGPFQPNLAKSILRWRGIIFTNKEYSIFKKDLSQ